jgi:CBS domain-containing protein
MILQDILAAKGSTIYSIRPEATLADVVQTLVRHNCGSLVVCQEDGGPHKRLLGIITERDILRACAKSAAQLDRVQVGEAMTRNVVTGSPHDTVEDTMGLMTERRVRHLPILENDRLVGIISIGDVVKAQHDALSMENHFLKSYIIS